MPKAYWIILLVGIVGALVFAGCKATRAGYESPRYRVISKDGKFEIRDYPALVVAQANMPAAERSQDNGFRRLFKYITGSNSGAEKIAMTTPVLVNDSDRSMSFVLPAKYSLAAAPAPTDSSVELKTLKPARYAVLRFSGAREGKKPAEAAALLSQWISQQNLAASGDAQFAFYDPPWTPAFLRRNEVLIEISDPPSGPR